MFILFLSSSNFLKENIKTNLSEIITFCPPDFSNLRNIYIFVCIDDPDIGNNTLEFPNVIARQFINKTVMYV